MENYQWIFSGIGVMFISIIGAIFYRKKQSKVITQKAGDKSINVQGNGSISIQTGVTPTEARQIAQDVYDINATKYTLYFLAPPAASGCFEGYIYWVR